MFDATQTALASCVAVSAVPQPVPPRSEEPVMIESNQRDGGFKLFAHQAVLALSIASIGLAMRILTRFL